jgi:hypothetical protein
MGEGLADAVEPGLAIVPTKSFLPAAFAGGITVGSVASVAPATDIDLFDGVSAERDRPRFTAARLGPDRPAVAVADAAASRVNW